MHQKKKIFKLYSIFNRLSLLTEVQKAQPANWEECYWEGTPRLHPVIDVPVKGWKYTLNFLNSTYIFRIE